MPLSVESFHETAMLGYGDAAATAGRTIETATRVKSSTLSSKR